MAQQVGPELGAQDEYSPGGIVGTDGRIYFAPCDAERMLCVDPATGSIELVGLSDGLDYKYHGDGTVSSRNGCLYWAPCRASRILSLDPENQTATYVGPD